MNSAISELLSDLDVLETEHDFSNKFENTFSSLGYNSFTYLGFNIDNLKDPASSTEFSNVIYLTNSNPIWVNRYKEKSYEAADPTLRNCLTSRLPFRWTESYRANLRSQQETEFMSEAWECGVRRGLTIPVHGPSGEMGIISLNSDLSDSEFLRITEDTQYDVHLIAHYFHDAIQSKLGGEAAVPMPIPLTNRESEILKWTAEGKTAWEIGGILNISERTVNFHIQNVMEKFGVHNKTQAAAKAVGMGLL